MNPSCVAMIVGTPFRTTMTSCFSENSLALPILSFSISSMDLPVSLENSPGWGVIIHLPFEFFRSSGLMLFSPSASITQKPSHSLSSFLTNFLVGSAVPIPGPITRTSSPAILSLIFSIIAGSYTASPPMATFITSVSFVS